MKLIVQEQRNIANWIAKILPLPFAVAYIGACVWFAVWLTGSKWLGVPLGLILCKSAVVFYMNVYDKIFIPIMRRRERLRRRSTENCGRYGHPDCER